MECKYNISRLKPLFYLVPAENIRYSDYGVEVENAERHDCLNVSFSGQSALDERYQFNKGLTIVFEGYQPDMSLEGKRIVVETVNSEAYVIDWEFDLHPLYRYTLNSSDNSTTYDLDFSENLPILPCSDVTLSQGTVVPSECKYALPAIKKVSLVKHAKCSLGNNEVVLYDTEPITFDNLIGASFSEEYDGYKYEQTLQFQIPLNKENVVDKYKLQEFLTNKYLCVISPENMIAGRELGMQVQTTISSEDDTSSITIQLTSDENIHALQMDEVTFNDNPELTWRYIMKAENGEYGWVCQGNEPNPEGNAMYILKEGFYANGQSSGKYLVHEDYASWFHALNIIGKFSGNTYFYKDSCYADDTLTVSYLTSPKTFQIVGASWSFEVKSKFSDWTATTIPSFVTLSSSQGSYGRSSVTMTCTGATSQQGQLVIQNAKYTQVFTIIADYSDAVIVPSSTISYSAQTKSYPCRRQVYLHSQSSTSPFNPSVRISGKLVTIVYPENQSGSDVVYTFVFKETAYPHREQTVTITQQSGA